jgi:hypothetical protein
MPTKISAGGAGTNQYQARGAARQRPSVPDRPGSDLLRQFVDSLRRQDQPPVKTPSQTHVVIRHEYPDLRVRAENEAVVEEQDGVPFHSATILQHGSTGLASVVSWLPLADLDDDLAHKYGVDRRPATAVVAQDDTLLLTTPPRLSGGFCVGKPVRRPRAYDSLGEALRQTANGLRARGVHAYMAREWPGLAVLCLHGYKPVVVGLGEDLYSTCGDDFSYAEKQFPNGWSVRAIGGAKLSGPQSEVVGFSLHDPAGRQIDIPHELLPPGTHFNGYRDYEHAYMPGPIANTYTMDSARTEQLRSWIEAYAEKAAAIRRRA